jgi:hypothetical protein
MRGQGVGKRVAVLIVSLLCVAAIAGIVMDPSSGAAPAEVTSVFPTDVRGYVRDGGGNPLEGADVTVSMIKPDTTLRASWTDTTDSDGLYITTFAPSEWEVGDTIQVVAEYGLESGSNSVAAADVPIQYVDVTVGTAIPEFSDLGTVASVGGMLAMFLVVFSARRRKNT